MNKKGQFTITDLGAVAIALLVAAVVLGLGGTILDEMQDTQTDNSATTLNNVSWTWTDNTTEQAFSGGRVVTSSVVVWCNTSLLVVNQNYSVSNSGVTIINTSGSTTGIGVDIDLCIFNMSYNYNYGSHSYNASEQGLSGVTSLAEFIPTIAIVVVAAIVIGVVLLMFAGRRRY